MRPAARHPFAERNEKRGVPCAGECSTYVLLSWKTPREDCWCLECGWTRKEKVGPHDCGDWTPDESGIFECASCKAVAPNQWTLDGTFIGIEGVQNPALAEECRRHYPSFTLRDVCAWCGIRLADEVSP